MEQLISKIKDIVKSLNDKGIPIPIMRDMVNNQPSITYTMLVSAYILTVLSSFEIGADKLGLRFDQCLELLGYVGIGYIGRKYQKGNVTIEGKEKE